jgi:hypothetical protein
MARSRFTDPIEPMDLANMRANGVRSLDIMCQHVAAGAAIAACPRRL